MQFREMDDHVTYRDQLAALDANPVRLVNLFTMEPADADKFLRAWARDAAFMKGQQGFITTQLHRGTAGSTAFLNIATWESARALDLAFRSPEFQRAIQAYPPSVVAQPHLFTPVAVDGICIAR